MTRRMVLLALAVALSGCGGKNEVGNESLLNFQDQAQQRLGGATPTPVPAGATPAPTAAPRATAAGAATPQPTAAPDRAPAIVVAINSDSAGSSFDPSVVRVPAGATVQWVNNDTIRRSVEADDGRFASGLIEPGATWSWTAAGSGRINYHDGTRPYAVAAIEVVAR